MGSTKNLVQAIQELWSAQHEEPVQRFATLLGKAMEDEAAFISLASETSSKAPVYVDLINQWAFLLHDTIIGETHPNRVF